MDLVVDTNVLVSAILRPGLNRRLVFHPQLRLHAPDFTLEELAAHRDEFTAKSGLSPEEFAQAVALVMRNVRVVENGRYSAHRSHALSISPDPEDWPFFALALHLRCGLWSQEKRLKRQRTVAVFDTSELSESHLPSWELPGP